jgi:hypothetical protein
LVVVLEPVTLVVGCKSAASGMSWFSVFPLKRLQKLCIFVRCKGNGGCSRFKKIHVDWDA